MFTTPAQVKVVIREMLSNADLTVLIIGTVSAVTPLRIRINQKLEITADNLYFTKNVLGWRLEAAHTHEYTDTHSGQTTAPGSGEVHDHGIPAQETAKTTASALSKHFVLEEPLKVGDKVLIIKNLGGQEYVLLDKLRKLEQIVTA